MSAEAYQRFLASMVMDFDKWHDGTGYDLDAIDEMTEDEKATLVTSLSARLEGWRDLQALAYIDTPAAQEAIIRARSSNDPDLRLRAHRYHPRSEASDKEEAILAALTPGAPLSHAIDAAIESPTPRIIQALIACVEQGSGPEADEPAAALLCIAGIIDSRHSFDERPFLLRLVDANDPDRPAAIAELKEKIAQITSN